jgi:hypothetical protein
MFALLIGGLFGFVPQCQAQSVQTWSEPIKLSMSGAGSSLSIVVDSNGIVHVLWIDKSEGYKYVERPDGKTWSSPVSMNYPFSLKQALPPLFVVDPKGVIHIFWLDDKNGLGVWLLNSDTECSIKCLSMDALLDNIGSLDDKT